MEKTLKALVYELKKMNKIFGEIRDTLKEMDEATDNLGKRLEDKE